MTFQNAMLYLERVERSFKIMKTYLVEFQWLAPYPKQMDLRVAASSVSTASARAIRAWRKENGRKKLKSINLHITAL